MKHDIIDSIGRTQRAKFITEGNLYWFMTHSNLPAAERLRPIIRSILTRIEPKRPAGRLRGMTSPH